MDDPVVAADGETYERRAIEEWIQRRVDMQGHVNSPMTGDALSHLALTRNVSLYRQIREYYGGAPPKPGPV